MRAEGTCSAVRRSIAALRAWRSCTNLFHHGSTGEKNRKRGVKVAIKKLTHDHECVPALRAKSKHRKIIIEGRGTLQPKALHYGKTRPID